LTVTVEDTALAVWLARWNVNPSQRIVFKLNGNSTVRLSSDLTVIYHPSIYQVVNIGKYSLGFRNPSYTVELVVYTV